MTESTTPSWDYRVLIMLDTIEIGGPGKGMLQFCKYAPAQVQITLSNFLYSGLRPSLFNSAAKAAGVDLIEMKQASKLDVRPLRLLKKIAADQKINIVQSHSFKAHLAAAWISRELKIPWLAFAHGWTAENRRVRLYNSLERRLLRRANKICVVSNTLKSEYLRQGISESSIEVMTNAVERVAEPPSGMRSNTTPILLCVGRLSFEKGHDLLINALSLLRERKWQLVVVGDGPERRQLESQAKSLGLAERIRFAGHVADVSGYYTEASLLVVPSRSEGIPNVILEAFGSGVPVVACHVGGVPDIVANGETGWLCAPQVSDLSDKIADALDNPDLRQAMASRAWSSLYPRFSPVQRANRMIEIHNDLISRSALSRAHQLHDTEESK